MALDWAKPAAQAIEHQSVSCGSSVWILPVLQYDSQRSPYHVLTDKFTAWINTSYRLQPASKFTKVE